MNRIPQNFIFWWILLAIRPEPYSDIPFFSIVIRVEAIIYDLRCDNRICQGQQNVSSNNHRKRAGSLNSHFWHINYLTTPLPLEATMHNGIYPCHHGTALIKKQPQPQHHHTLATLQPHPCPYNPVLPLPSTLLKKRKLVCCCVFYNETNFQLILLPLRPHSNSSSKNRRMHIGEFLLCLLQPIYHFSHHSKFYFYCCSQMDQIATQQALNEQQQLFTLPWLQMKLVVCFWCFWFLYPQHPFHCCAFQQSHLFNSLFLIRLAHIHNQRLQPYPSLIQPLM